MLLLLLSIINQLIGRCLARKALLTHSNVAHWLPKIFLTVEQMRKNYSNKFLFKIIDHHFST